MTRFICLPVDRLDELEGAEVGLLVTLYRYADAGHTCFPSHETLAAKVKRSRQWVCAALMRMEKLGIIKVERRRRQDGGKMSSVYSLPTHVTQDDMVCRSGRQGHVAQDDNNKTPDSKNTPTPAREGVVDLPKPTSLPEGWCPSDRVLMKAQRDFPNCDLKAFTEFFHCRIAQMDPPKNLSRNWDARWREYLTGDHKRFTKEQAHAGGSRFPSARERKLEDDRARDAENERRARECLDRIHARRARH